jgi:hypothetical protein
MNTWVHGCIGAWVHGCMAYGAKCMVDECMTHQSCVIMQECVMQAGVVHAVP